MKKLMIMFGMLLVIGAGCAVKTPDGLKEVVDESEFSATEWYLTGEKDDWYAYEPYDGIRSDFGVGKERTTARQDAKAFFQNVDQPIELPNRQNRDDLDYYDGDDWVLLDVLVYPEQARMPPDVELIEIDGRNVGVRRGNAFDAWYWKTDDLLFEIFFYTAEGSGITPEEVFAELKLQ